MLPRTNCKKCGCMTCYAFAFDMISRKKKPVDCPKLQEDSFRPALAFLQEALGEGKKLEGTDFVLDAERCNGCGICAIACQRSSTTGFSEGRTFKLEEKPPVIQMSDGILKVANWSSCKRVSGDTLCKVCVEKCPFKCLDLVK